MVEQEGVISLGHTLLLNVCVRAWDVSLSTQQKAWSCCTIHLKMVAVFWNIVADFELDFKWSNLVGHTVPT